MKKSCVIFGFRSKPIQLELVFEIAIQRARDGYSVLIAWGGEDVYYNEIYKGRHSILWARPFYRLYARVQNEDLDITLDDTWLKTSYSQHPLVTVQASTVADYRSVVHEGYEVGTAAISVLTDVLKVDATAIPIDSVRDQLALIISSSLNVYKKALDLLTNFRADEVVVFNGRFGPESAVANASKSKGVKVFYYEYYWPKAGYLCWPFQVHDVREYSKLIYQFWDAAEDSPVKEAVAKQWFDTRIQSEELLLSPRTGVKLKFDKWSTREDFINEYSLPEKYVVYYQSSDDEYVGVASSNGTCFPWKNQIDFVRILEQNLPSDTCLVVRIHPHMREKSKIDRQRWQALALELTSARFFFEDSNIDSYALGRYSQKSVVCRSTIGAELLYMGVPVLVASDSYYENATGCQKLSTVESIKSKVMSAVEVDPVGVLPYGYFRATFKGTQPQYLTVNSEDEVTFDGINYFHGFL